MANKRKKKTTKKSKHNIFLRIALICMLLHFVNMCAQLTIEYFDGKQTELRLSQEVEQLEVEIENAQYLLESSSEKEVIERAARERFNYAYPDETIYIDISGQ